MDTFCAYSAQEKREQGKHANWRAGDIILVVRNNRAAFNETYINREDRDICFAPDSKRRINWQTAKLSDFGTA